MSTQKGQKWIILHLYLFVPKTNSFRPTNKRGNGITQGKHSKAVPRIIMAVQPQSNDNSNNPKETLPAIKWQKIGQASDQYDYDACIGGNSL